MISYYQTRVLHHILPLATCRCILRGTHVSKAALAVDVVTQSHTYRRHMSSDPCQISWPPC